MTADDYEVRFTFVDHQNRESEFALKPGAYTLGRAEDCDIVLSQEAVTVSRHHAELSIDRNQTTVTDLDSMAGTVLNDTVIARGETRILGDGDCIRIGDCHLYVHLPGGGPAAGPRVGTPNVRQAPVPPASQSVGTAPSLKQATPPPLPPSPNTEKTTGITPASGALNLDVLMATVNTLPDVRKVAAAAAFVLSSWLLFALTIGIIVLLPVHDAAKAVAAAIFLVPEGATMLGLLIGTLSYMIHRELECGQRTALGDVVAFLKRRIVPLSVSLLLIVSIIGVTAAVINSIMFRIVRIEGAGPYIAAVVFIPMLVVNLVCIGTPLWALLTPCTIAVEDCGIVNALSRLAALIWRRWPSLLFSLAVSFLTVGSAVVLLGTLVAAVGAGTTSVVGESLTHQDPQKLLEQLLNGNAPPYLYLYAAELLLLLFLVLCVLAVTGTAILTTVYRSARERVKEG